MEAGSAKIGSLKPRGSGGFTLVELLVVMAVVALLSAILYPALIKAKECAKVSECLSNMRQIGAGVHMYIDENGGRFPAAVSYGTPNYWHARGRRTFQELLSRYVSQGIASETVNSTRQYVSAGVFMCPGDIGPDRELAGTYGIVAGKPIWKSTGCSYEYYASNQEDWQRYDVIVPWTSLSPLVASATGRARVGALYSDVPSPTRKAVLGDMAHWHYGDRTTDNRLAYCNTLFADGHVARVLGSEHLEARLERLRPWHTATEVPYE